MNREAAIAHWTERLMQKMPDEAAPLIAKWIVDLRVHFVISKPRKTKLGDFMAPHQGKPARISVNSDLNPYNFLITSIHEFAHLGCFLKHANKVNPHGIEWKNIYTDLLKPFISKRIFPEELIPVLVYHVSNPLASSCTCPKLSRALAKYDNNPGTFLSDIAAKEVFVFHNIEYKKLEMRRTRYICKRLSDGKKFLISGRAFVETPELKLT